ncbi:MAG: hypothetical protein H6529_02845 [Nocardioides sp.]|nr:hypothetical protein [Nocardioidaceae bacterium]MCB8955398.1 hypothetical protein [Nocardioides sp.]
MSHRLPARARVTLGAVKVALVGSIVAAAWGTSVETTSQSGFSGFSGSESGPGYSGYSGYPVDDAPDHLQQVLDAHDCSPTGFGDRSVPRSAVVRTATGRLRHVSFDAGWRVYHRHGAAQLVAVCHDAPTSRGARG